ncbi:MAG: class I SAM-dependent methyltransferase [Gammaproteobacteria bacterium]|nr:class I SAM-dependent methyltransferase [Gammaproteobacteria bacterium]
METEHLSEIYDKFAASYDENRDAFNIDHIINGFHSKLASQTGKLLDLGCGAGVPLARSFIGRDWEVTGVDFSQNG